MVKSTPRKSTSTGAAGGKSTVKVIHSVDSVLGKDTTVFFTDGTHAVIKAGDALAQSATDKEFVAPNMVQVTINRGIITDMERVDTRAVGG